MRYPSLVWKRPLGSKETRQKRDFNSDLVPDIENNYERSIKSGVHEVKTSSRFFKNQPCNDLSERRQKAGFFGPDKPQNHTNEGKEQQKKKKRGGRKEEKRKKQWLLS